VVGFNGEGCDNAGKKSSLTVILSVNYLKKLSRTYKYQQFFNFVFPDCGLLVDMGLCVLKACLPGICFQARLDIGALRIYRPNTWSALGNTRDKDPYLRLRVLFGEGISEHTQWKKVSIHVMSD
jgi:hypothetical protein